MLITKPKYIRKYDFQRYFFRPQEQWFLNTSWITERLHELTKQAYKNKKFKEAEDADEDADEESEWEFDSYEFLKELDIPLQDLDVTDPKVIEGNMIDEQSKKYISELYPQCKIMDLKAKFDSLTLANMTIKLLQENKNIIIFQPTFIYKDIAIAKPDAFIKLDNKFILIETKGTTSSKCVHIVDITYQAHICNETIQKYFNKKIDEYYLCIVAYELKNKMEISFKLTPWANNSKSSMNGKIDEEKYSEAWIEERAEAKEGITKNLKFSDCVNEDFFHSKIKYANLMKFISNYNEIVDEDKFDAILNELHNVQINENPTFDPSPKYKSWFKDNDYLKDLKEYYFSQNEPKYIPFHFSGYVLNYAEACDALANEWKFDDIINFLSSKTTKDGKTTAGARYARAISSADFPIAKVAFSNFKNRTKKVYFDFESLNLATRVIDNTLPFMQTVNQVSVIFDHGDKIITESNNVVIDPLKMNLDSYKEIIDAILPPSNQNEYWYIVYNKSFERSRLNEMKSMFYLNKKTYASEYEKKINIIIENMYDIADFFDPRKDMSILFEKVYGYYSIKKILPIINDMYPEIFKQVKCLDYKSLINIQNGNDAQKAATQRFFNILNDAQWQDTVSNLKIYCENDVRAMIAVEYMLEKLLA